MMYTLHIKKYRNKSSYNYGMIQWFMDKKDIKSVYKIYIGRYLENNENSFELNDIKFEFSQDFVKELYGGVIEIYGMEENSSIIEAKFTLSRDCIDHEYIIMFKLVNKNKIHFWNDLDYIMNNLTEKFEDLQHPKTEQILDIATLVLRRI